ncbi:unnamed protein product [Echinostoma caproni]|uniref:DUF4456 domain-containing protein n=1 Tax=Echinostoma caproni TaxID=27848 RepID=A0A183A8L0_9TREM|nr:unnamed protein product [Echinostoma caproni]
MEKSSCDNTLVLCRQSCYEQSRKNVKIATKLKFTDELEERDELSNTDENYVQETFEVLDLPDPGFFQKLPALPRAPNSEPPAPGSSKSDAMENDRENRSQVLERLTGKRRIKHNLCLENWRSELSRIGQDIELRLMKASTETANALEESWSRQKEAVDFFSKDIDHPSVQSHEVLLSWSQLEKEASKRRTAISNLEHNLEELEDERISKSLNAELMANRCQISTLIKNLQTADLLTQRRFELVWTDHKKRWQQINTDNCIQNFKIYVVFREEVYQGSLQLCPFFYVSNAIHTSLLKQQCFSWSADANLHAFASPLYRFGQMLANFWQEIGVKPISQRHQNLLNQLAETREGAVKEISVKDEILNQAIDALRQSSTEEQVDERLNEVLRILDQIKSIYDTTRNKLLTVVNQYPADVLDCVDLYETVCQRFFGVVRSVKPDRSLTERLKQSHNQSSASTGIDEVICIKQPERSRSQLDQWIQTRQPFKLASPETGSSVTALSVTTRSTTSTNTTTAISSSDSRRSKKTHQPTNPCCWFRSKPREEAVNDLGAPLTATSFGTIRGSNETDRDRPAFTNVIQEQVNNSGILGMELPTDLTEPPTVLVSKGKSLRHQKPTPKTSEANTVMIQTASGAEPISIDKAVTDAVQLVPIAQYEGMIHEIKRKARENFLTHFEEWRFKILDQVQEEVLLRKAEVEAEYELQLHLHEPRIRRSREDVANVRRTELVLHQARIDRHVEQVKLLLGDLQTRGVDEVDTQLDTMQTSMIESLQAAIRAKLTTATKSSMLRSLRNTVNDILDKYMNQVRECLRSFRQKLEYQTQEIRNSNMALVDTLRELGSQITVTEEHISGKLESIEGGRQSFVDHQRKLFEQELRVHMMDVTYMENILRSVTNAITQIKSNVADSESQKKRLRQELAEFDSILGRLSGFVQARDHLLQQVITETIPLMTGFANSTSMQPVALSEFKWNESDRAMQHEASAMAIRLLTGLCSNAADRCVFLNCLRAQTEPPMDEHAQGGGQPSTNRIGQVIRNDQRTVQPEPTAQSSLPREPVSLTSITFLSTTHVSRAGRAATDDACIRVVQSIMKAQTRYTDHTDESAPASIPGTAETVEQGRVMGFMDDLADGNEDHAGSVQSVSRPSLKQGKDKHGKKDYSQSPKLKQVTDKVEKKTKGGSRNRAPKSAAKRCKMESYYEAFGSTPTQVTGRTEQTNTSDVSGRRPNTVMSTEDKFNVEKITLLGRVRLICRENLTVALQLTESYYRQKGLRRPTRPQFIPQSLDDAASLLVSQLRKYYADAEAYRDNEVRGQLVDEIKLDILISLRAYTQQMWERFHKLNALRQKHIELLHPYLGAPSNKKLLEQLSIDEEKRHEEYLQLAKELHRLRHAVVTKYGRRGFSQLGGLTDGLFIRFDRLTSEYDIEEIPDMQAVYVESDSLALDGVDKSPKPNWETDAVEKPLELMSRGKKTFYAVESAPWDSPSNSTSPALPSLQNLSMFRSDRPGKEPKNRTRGGRMQIRTGEMRSPVSFDGNAKVQSNQSSYCVVTAKTTRAHISVLESRTSAAEVSLLL